MNRIDRYLIRTFLFGLFWSLLAFWAVFMIVDLVEHLDKFIDKGAPAKYVGLYYAYYSPYILILILPIAVLLATLFSVGFLSKRNELLAMRAAGLSLGRLSLPLLFIGLLIAGGVFYAGETVYPKAEANRLELADQFLRGAPRPSQVLLRDRFATGLDGRVFYFKTYNTVKGIGHDVTVQAFEDGRVVELWKMDELHFIDSVWMGFDGRHRLFANATDTIGEYVAFDMQEFPDWREVPVDFTRKRVDPKKTGYFELKAIVERMKSTGGQTTKEETELALKVAFPFLNFLVILIGFPIAARTKQSGMALNFGIAMGVTFILRVLIEVFRSLGHNGDIPASLAAWAPNIICFVAGMVILYRTRR